MDTPNEQPKEGTPQAIQPKQHTVRTYASDLAEAMRENQGSMVKIALAEQERRDIDDANNSPTSKKNILLALGAVLLIGLGVGIFFIATKKAPSSVPLTDTGQTSLPTLIVADSDNAIDITGGTPDTVLSTIGSEVKNATPKLNTIERLVLVERPEGSPSQQFVTTARLFEAIDSRIPKSLLRSFDAYPTLAIHAFDGNDLLMLLHSDSYTTTFSGMLEWEPSLFDDLYRMFAIEPTGERAELSDAKWKDMVIKNQDTRALLDLRNKPILFYTFLGEDKSLLLVTTKESTLAEILNRLQTPKTKR